jgi:hypothetical protein
MGRKKMNLDGPISVRLTPAQQDWIDEKRNGVLGNKLNDNSILRDCLSFVMRQDKHVQNDVLKGMYREEGLVRSYGEQAEDNSWSIHSYQKGYYEWSLAEYGRLALDGGSMGLQRLAHAKSTYILLFLAAEIRREAYLNAGDALRRGKITPDWHAYFQEADRCLRLALFHAREFMRCNRELPAGKINREFIIYYNLCCTYSLLAQYSVEALIPKWREPAAGRALGERLSECLGNRGGVQSEDEAWSEIGKGWRQMLPKAEVANLKRRTDGYAREALRCLDAIERDGAKYHAAAYLDTSFIARRAVDDPDLTFLRCDDSEEIRAAFEHWSTSRVGSRRDFFLSYFNSLPEALRREIESPEAATLSDLAPPLGG